MFFRYFKKLAAGVKTKTLSRKCGFSKLTWNVDSSDRINIKRIMVFGDSNSFRPERSKTSWPELLEGRDPRHLNVFNESCDGRTTRYDIRECNGLSVIDKKLTAHAPLDYVVVMLGTNDVKSKYGPPSTAGIVNGMRQILDLVKTESREAKPILLTPPPIGNVISGELAGAQPRIPPIIAEYRLLAMSRDIRLIDIHSILEISMDLESDMVHLNTIGRQKVANAVWDNIQGENPHNEQAEVQSK